jgi:hypothetical protein
VRPWDSEILGSLIVQISRTVARSQLGARIRKVGEVLMSKEAFLGIDISKDQLDVHIVPQNAAFGCKRDGKGIPKP